MAPWRTALGVGIVVVLAVVTGLVVMSSFNDDPHVDPSPIAAAPSATRSPTVESDPMPQLHNTGEDFDKIYRSIEDFRNWLYRNPDPGFVDQIYHADCECFHGLKEDLHKLVADGVHFSRSETVIHEISVLSEDAQAVALKIVDEGVPQIVVDSKTGEVVDRGDGWEKRAYRFLLVRDGERWLVKDIAAASLDLAPPTPHESG